MATERSGGRRRRWSLGALVALLALLPLDQRGLPVQPAAARSVEVEGRTLSRTGTLAGGFDNLAARLRLADAVPTTVPVGGAEALAGGGGELAIAPPKGFDRAELASTVLAAPPRALRPSAYDASVAAPGTWALVIGINDYPGDRYDLRSAVNDANDVNDALAQLGVTGDRRLVLRDTQAGAGTIRAAVDWLTAHAGPDATMVFFFAGHVEKLAPGREALVGADGGLVQDDELASMLDRSPARRAWIGIAACFAGGFTEVVRPGRILTAAAGADDVAYENTTFGRSYLVEYMVRRAMLQQGITTVEGAFRWAVAALQQDYPNRQPVEFDDIGGDLDLKVPPPPPPSDGGSGAGAPSGGGTPPRTPPPPTYDPTPPPPKPDDGCANLTVGVVRCE
jgi:hypothetical protein